MKTWITAALILAAAFIGGWLLGRRASQPEVVETVRIDTVFYKRPEPVRISDNRVTVNIPRILFATKYPEQDYITNQDTTQVTNQDTTQVTNQVGDSITIPITVRTLEYRDSTYYARVVGPVVGDLSPYLDYIETYNTTTTKTQAVEKRRRFGLDAIAGTEYAQTGWAPFAELAFSVDLNFATLSATVGADDVLRNPIPRVGISASVPLWSR